MLFATHDSPLNALAITPDGTHIIAGAYNRVLVWDRVTEELVQTFSGHTTPVRALSVTPDGNVIISASSGGTVRLWDRTLGVQVGEPFAGHSGWTVAPHPDGKRIVSGTDAGELIIWHRDGSEFGETLPAHEGEITAVVITPDGEQIISAARDNTIRLTTIATGESRTFRDASEMSGERTLAISPGGAWVVSGGTSGIAKIWEVATGWLMDKTGAEHSRPITSLAFTPDGKRFVSASEDGTVRLWNSATCEPIGEPFTGHAGPVHAVAMTSDGTGFASAGQDGSIHIWDLPGQRALYQHGASVHAVAITADGSRLISGGKDGTLKVWDRSTEQLIHTLSGHRGPVKMLAISRDGNEFVSAAGDAVRIWNTDDGTLVAEQTGGILAAAANVDAREIVFAKSDGEIWSWMPAEGQLMKEFETGLHTIDAVALTPDRAEIIVGNNDGSVWTLDRSADVRKAATILHTAGVESLVVTPDGSAVVAGDEDGIIRIWSRATGEIRELIVHDGEVWSVAVTADGGRVVSGAVDGTVRVWDRFDGQLLETFTGHSGEVHSVAIAGELVVSGGQDGTVRTWQLPGPGPVPRVVPLAEVVSDLESAEDRLGIAADVRTIAAVVAALSTRPPLSIALLGDWGIGKSSFMRQVRDRVEELARQSAGGQSAFAANVRQVRFNAWHYSDDHLWVGLVEHLFRELARHDGDGAARRRQELEEELNDRKAERDRLAEDLRLVERRRGLLALFRSAQVARATVSGLWRELRSGGWRTWVAVLVLAVGAAGIVLGEGVLRWLGGVVAVLGPVAVAWRRLGEYTETARRRLANRKSEVDTEIKAVEEELSKVDPARRLDKLLKEISTADRYESYRGLTGRIHHDLRRLSDDLATARDQWDGTGTPPLQRIVLYVDDLDRCTPSRVVDVLQAVNLLLTMDLFVVVVAVDPRWLLRSLRRHHEGLFDANEVAYLDKIFHIPVALRPMGDHAVGYLRSLLPTDETPEPRAVRQPAVQEVPQAPAVSAAPVRRLQVSNTPVRPAVTSNVVRRPQELNPEGLRLRGSEKEFLERLTPLLGTPRAIKKLVNLYRLLRLGVGEDRLAEFLGGEQGGPYQAAALLLAALVGAPHDARKLLQGLANVEVGQDIIDVVPSPGLRDLIVRIREDVPVHGDSGTYRRWAKMVARYGFETYDLFSD